MIVLNVTYKCKEGMRERFLEAVNAEGLAAASRAEEGNIKYDYYFPESSSDELLLVEKWRDADAFTFHCDQAHFKRLGELKGEFVNETVLEKYFTD